MLGCCWSFKERIKLEQDKHNATATLSHNQQDELCPSSGCLFPECWLLGFGEQTHKRTTHSKGLLFLLIFTANTENEHEIIWPMQRDFRSARLQTQGEGNAVCVKSHPGLRFTFRIWPSPYFSLLFAHSHKQIWNCRSEPPPRSRSGFPFNILFCCLVVHSSVGKTALIRQHRLHGQHCLFWFWCPLALCVCVYLWWENYGLWREWFFYFNCRTVWKVIAPVCRPFNVRALLLVFLF